MSIKNKFVKDMKKAAKSKANELLRKEIFRLARQRDILGLAVIVESITIVALVIFIFTHI